MQGLYGVIFPYFLLCTTKIFCCCCCCCFWDIRSRTFLAHLVRDRGGLEGALILEILGGPKVSHPQNQSPVVG